MNEKEYKKLKKICDELTQCMNKNLTKKQIAERERKINANILRERFETEYYRQKMREMIHKNIVNRYFKADMLFRTTHLSIEAMNDEYTHISELNKALKRIEKSELK